MTLFDLYEDKMIRLTDDDGNMFTGIAETFPSGYGLHEYGREEEGMILGEYVVFRSQIRNVEYLPTFEEAVSSIPAGRYRHYKGGEYQVLGIARHSETEEPLVVYRALYGEQGLWVRPAYMWNQKITQKGQTVSRFEKFEDPE